MLTNEGFRMVGVDLSPGMIGAARRKAEAKKLDIRYEIGDAARFDMRQKYDAAFSFFDSLNNILDGDDLQAAFGRVFAHLKPGGSWVFDLNMAYAFEERMFDQEHLRAGAKLRYKWVGDYDPGTRIIKVTMRFWHGGEEFVEVHHQRAYAPDQVVAMLEKVGFEEIHAYHSYTLNPPRPKSDRLHFTAIRPA
jgi:SAM-dependent methyltransferase